jgi:4-amino-4-deoxy-L-arabinose transferase-like glycosyltransferase
LRRFLLLALGSVTLLALAVRCLAIAEPLGIDQSLWASAVRGMARGQRLYRDVWEQRPPGIYWIYLAGFKTFGWTAGTVAWLDAIAAATTTAALFVLGRALAGPLEGAVAAALYSTLTMPAWLYRYDGFLERSVCETFIVPCAALAACCALRVRERADWPAAIGLGLFAGGAIVLKPNAGLYLPALLVWVLVYRRRPLADTAPPIVLAAIAAAVVPMIVFAWLWRLDLLHDAKVAVVDFNRFYVSQGFAAGSYALAFAHLVWLRIKTEPLWTAGAVAAVVAMWELLRTRRLPPLAGLAVIWGGAATLVIIVNGARLFNSYFINALAPLALLGSWGLVDSARRSGARRWLTVATLAIMAGLLVQRHYVAKVFDWAQADYRVLSGGDHTAFLDRFGSYGAGTGYSARANEELADYVRAHTGPDDRVFLFGINGAGLYFAADRLVAQRFLRVNFFVPDEFPEPSFRLEAVCDELAARRPAYLIFETLHSKSAMAQQVDTLQQHQTVRRLLASYALETRIEDFTLYRRME